MKKTYNPHAIESHWSQYWEQHTYARPSGKGAAYCIVLPPPNVTGTLHMGHGFQLTLMDALIRQHRMQGDNTLWQAGTDHAGIATQMVVERQLAQEGFSRHQLGRDAFIQRVWQWREHSGATITQQIHRLGASIDWSRQKFSMDPDIHSATVEAFCRLYQEGLIYRGQRLVNWDPVLKTALSDLEVDNIEIDSHLWYLRYPIVETDQYLTIATTRPETLLGDTAVAVHPEDPRYQHHIGQTIQLPITKRTIPIIADNTVDQNFGTGCVKITPAHDVNDYAMAQRHDLPIITIFTEAACLNQKVPSAYQGLERHKARQQVIAELKAQGLLEKVIPYRHRVPHGDRSGALIEPMLTDQWFIKTKALAKPAMAAVERGDLKLIPHHWTKTYLQWLDQIEDWCISRQLWWGHRIPVWYDSDNNLYIGHNETNVRQRYQLAPDLPLQQDPDVLDTWFTAALWPFSSLGWPQSTDALNTFYPTQVLVTGFDIIFFWVARMVMLGLHLMGQVPFRQIYITGLIRDSHGQKMSKSKGNILDPIDLIDGIDQDTLIKKRSSALMQPAMAASIKKMTQKEFPQGIAAYGTDALRFTFCALATPGRDINFDLGRLDGYRNFCNKLWNAARYVLMNTEHHDLNPENAQYSVVDRWITSQLQNTIKTVQQHFSQYRFDLLAHTLYEFTWNNYCDWYLELSKSIINNPKTNEAQQRGTRFTLIQVLETLLRLIHPIMPFITEAIWQTIAPKIQRGGSTIMLAPYPEFDATAQDLEANDTVDRLQRMIRAIRTVRSDMKISPAQAIQVIFDKGNINDRQRISDCQTFLTTLARIKQITWHQHGAELPACAKTSVDSVDIYIPLAGVIDKAAELSRLQKEITKHQKEYDKAAQKLNNPHFVEKAPPAIIEQEQERLTHFKQIINTLTAHQQQIKALP